MGEVTERDLKRELLLAGFPLAAEEAVRLFRNGRPERMMEHLSHFRETGKLHNLALVDMENLKEKRR